MLSMSNLKRVLDLVVIRSIEKVSAREPRVRFRLLSLMGVSTCYHIRLEPQGNENLLESNANLIVTSAERSIHS
jgi:hypothetical protein